ncbi:MAG: ankyrin repeat domain-containing protein [Armatimonadetes bacterium]|nr:ankyrin repeat domain-containing protein [Armatimonadota bacterium]
MQRLFSTIIVLLYFAMGASAGEIHEAMYVGDNLKVKTLLQADPQLINAKDEAGLNLIHRAAVNGHKGMVVYLLNHGAQVPPLHAAVLRNDFLRVKQLLKSNRKQANLKDSNGVAPLHYAAMLGYTSVAETLIRRGANVGVQCDVKGVPGSDSVGGRLTPLHYAALNGHALIAIILIARGANVNAVDIEGHTPLYEAAFGGHRDVAQLLIRRKARIDAMSDNGTPLHGAAFMDHLDMVKFLVSQGAKINLANAYGETSLALAESMDNKDVADYLRSKGGKRAP